MNLFDHALEYLLFRFSLTIMIGYKLCMLGVIRSVTIFWVL